MGRIAILLPDLRGGGVERVRLVLAREFIRLGYSVDFVLRKAGGELLDLVPDTARVINLKSPRVRNLVWPLVRYLRRERPDALLASMWPLTTLAPAAARLAGYKGRVVVSEHNALSVQYRNWGQAHRHMLRLSMAAGYRAADARVAVSAGVADDLAALSGHARDRFRVIYNPVRPPQSPTLSEMERTEALWQGPLGSRILSVGSLKAQKNHGLLINAVARMQHRTAKLLLLGQGAAEASLRRIAAELEIADRVIFAGFRVDPLPFYATADLFALSSDYEGFGNVIVEALGHGLPVVSTDCPSGPAEILENGRFGRLVPVGDAEALARAMDEALASDHDREALRRRAADFAPEIAASKYLELLFPEQMARRS